MELIGDMGQWNLVSVHLETSLVSAQDRCAVCAKWIIGSEIVLHTPMVLQDDEAQVDAHFGPFGDNAQVDAHDTR
jgi:hypothetical protein